MKINNVKIYDLEESLIASGYPMKTDLENLEFSEKDITRGERLARASDTTGNPAHQQFMTGIRVSFDLTFSNKAWVEAERYRFLEFVSSQSTMHRITKFDLKSQYNEYVDPRIIEIMQEKVDLYNKLLSEGVLPTEENMKDLYLQILYSNPSGFELTARITTNYRCLKNIYLQRKDHRLPEWREFCKWIETLPLFDNLIKI